ncbi:unnamed protein product [Sphagnum compactum]
MANNGIPMLAQLLIAGLDDVQQLREEERLGTEEAPVEEATCKGGQQGGGSVWSSLVSGTLAILEPRRVETESGGGGGCWRTGRGGGGRWDLAVKRVVQCGPMRRLQERLLGHTWYTAANASGSVIWVLGVCYKITTDSSNESVSPALFQEFLNDFSSRLWFTYRRGFEPISQSNLTSDLGWGCMLRSGQMLLAQALMCHHLGRSWRRSGDQLCSQEYLQIVKSFGDSPDESCPFSIHNLVDVGSPYGLAAGSWLGPYALCRTLEALADADRERCQKRGGQQVLPMVVHVVSGDADGERGGAPVLCVEDVTRLCLRWGEPGEEWGALLVLVPLVLGLDKVNPRYTPSLRATFTFPQSLGILGGKPGASTYLVGVQDGQALYLDPHETQQAVRILPENPEVDTSSYHCSIVRRIPLDSIDPSLALGFYCRNREEFDDLCARSSELAEQSNGAPMFTVAQNSAPIKPADTSDRALALQESHPKEPSSEDDWQIL